jgi:hypothetical protein
MNIGFRKAFLNLFRCLKQSTEPARKVSLSGYGNAAAPAITTTIHSMNNIDKNINNNNVVAVNSGSDNDLMSRQPSFSLHNQNNVDYDEIRCEIIPSIKNNDT